MFNVLVFVRQRKLQTIILSSDEEDKDNTGPFLNGDGSHLIEEVTITSLLSFISLSFYIIIFFNLA